MVGEIGLGSVTDCRLRSDSDLRQHTQQCRAAPRQKSKQMQPEPMSSPINYPVYQGVWFINKIIRYIPTYSGVPYHRFNEINFVIPILIILVTMQTKLGAKINLLVDRVMEVWDGQTGGGSSAQKSGNVKVRQPLAGIHRASRADTMDNTMIPPPAQTMTAGVDRSTTLINNLPNLNNSDQDPNSRYGSDVMNLAMMDGGDEPMAANGLLGGAFGSGW